MSKRPRRRFSDVQKTKAVLVQGQIRAPVSQVCDNLGIHPNRYYDWHKQAFLGLSQFIPNYLRPPVFYRTSNELLIMLF